MKCVICHGDSIAPREILEEVAVENDIVRVPITTPVCATCGECYYDPRTMRFLESVREQVRQERSGLKEVGRILLFGT